MKDLTPSQPRKETVSTTDHHHPRSSLKSNQHQARSGLVKPFGPQISFEKATGNFGEA